jgi:hypothetical protein
MPAISDPTTIQPPLRLLGAEACRVRTYIKGLRLYLRSFPKATQTFLHLPLHLPALFNARTCNRSHKTDPSYSALSTSVFHSISAFASRFIAHSPPCAHLPSAIPLQAQILQIIAVLLCYFYLQPPHFQIAKPELRISNSTSRHNGGFTRKKGVQGLQPGLHR